MLSLWFPLLTDQHHKTTVTKLEALPRLPDVCWSAEPGQPALLLCKQIQGPKAPLFLQAAGYCPEVPESDPGGVSGPWQGGAGIPAKESLSFVPASF